MHKLNEAIEPERTDEEIEADYVDHLLQTVLVPVCICTV